MHGAQVKEGRLPLALRPHDRATTSPPPRCARALPPTSALQSHDQLVVRPSAPSPGVDGVLQPCVLDLSAGARRAPRRRWRRSLVADVDRARPRLFTRGRPSVASPCTAPRRAVVRHVAWQLGIVLWSAGMADTTSVDVRSRPRTRGATQSRRPRPCSSRLISAARSARRRRRNRRHRRSNRSNHSNHRRARSSSTSSHGSARCLSR